MNGGIVYSMNSVIPIGYVGENETREIAIDIRPLVRTWPELVPVLLAKRPGEKTLHPCVTHVENGVLYWRVTLSDTAIPGKGECVIHMIDGEGRVGKSRTMTTMIERSASGEETQEPPEAIKPWIDEVLASIESVKEGYVEIEQGEENAGLVLVVGDDGRITLKKGGAGGDGVGVESVEQTQESLESGGENVWTLRLTDGTTSRLIVRNGARGAQGERGLTGETGPTGPQGLAGEPGASGPAGPSGADGKNGSDGVSPTVAFTRIDRGYRLTIKDAAGTHSAEIMDGADGPQGPEGPQGIQGPVGERGEQGERGAPFAIAKVYASQDAMNAGYATDGVPVGGFALIETGDVNDEENARLYVKGENRYEYVTDLSGAQGIQGPKGDTGATGATGPAGKDGAAGKDGTSVTVKSVSESSADGGSNVVTFSDGKTLTVKNGKTGAQGPAGADGKDGAQGEQGPKGDKGDTGAQGPKGDTGAQGPAGPAGADGKNGSDANVTSTNIKNALGYTPANETTVSQLSEKITAIGTQEQIVHAVIVALGGMPVTGIVDTDKNIILSAALEDGTYTVKFRMEDGSEVLVGEIVKDSGASEPEIIQLVWRLQSGINAETGNIVGAVHCAASDFVVIEPDAQFTISAQGLGNSRHVYTRHYDEYGTYLGGKQITVSGVATALEIPADAAMFRLHCADDSGAQDPSTFESSIVVASTNPSDIVAVPFDMTQGIKLDKTTGAESSDAGYAASNYIEVDSNAAYRLFTASVSYNILNINCFDASKTQIGYLATVIDQITSNDAAPAYADLTLPEGTKYIRIRQYHATTSDEASIRSYLNRLSLLKYPN